MKIQKKYIFLILCCFVNNCKPNFGKLVLPKVQNNVTQKDLIATGKEYAITSDSEFASKAGATMFSLGGNIVDASIAVSFVISVVRPQSTGIGGGGFLLLHLNNEEYAFNFRETAPIKSNANMFANTKSQAMKESLIGYKSIATPSLIAGLIYIHKKFGKLSFAQVIEPALSLAKNGFKVYPNLEQSIAKEMDLMTPEMKSIFAPNNKPLVTGSIFKQPKLANLLSLLSTSHEQAFENFYHGSIAKSIVLDIQKNGGILSFKDLKNYKVIETKPIYGKFQGYKVVTMPLPSSGKFILEMLENINKHPYKKICSNTENSYQILCKNLLIESMRIGFKHRAETGGDPRFGKTNTTHFSIMDKHGNAVSSTQSINYRFGSHAISADWGFVYNDTMDDFTTNTSGNIYGLTGSHINSIAPNKIPLSSMSPMFIVDHDSVIGVVGGMGGPFIMSGIFQTLVNNFILDLDTYSSVALERLHYQYKPDSIFYENEAIPKNILNDISFKNKKYFPLSVEGIPYHPARIFYIRKNKDNILEAVSDPRSDGKPIANP